MELITGAAIVCVAATIALWANDYLPHNEAEDRLLEIPVHET